MAEMLETPIESEMQSSYIDYAMSVIIGRALPDARDGLKPAQRRILFAMYKLNNVHDQPTKKSARIVGEVIGKYHPHGDVAVYETLVRMAQDFSMNHTLVEGQGNMGSIDGDPAAAQRYTEVRLNKIAEEMLADIEKESVTFVPNFDNVEQEPLILPTRLPNLLLNGASGIAVGVATNILSHNLSELSDAVIAYVDNPEITIDELMNYIKGPDFPTGGTVFRNNSLEMSYRYGRGSVTIRGKTVDEKIGNREAIIITEIPYMVNKATMVEEIANLVRSKRVTGISDLRDESGKEGIRVVIELKQDTDKTTLLNQLYNHTKLQVSMPVMNIAVLGKELVTLNLKQFLKVFVDHRVSVITARSNYDLRVASERLHIVDGLLIAVSHIDELVSLIKKSKDIKEARAALIDKYGVSEKQANAVLDMKLSRLTSLETESLQNEKGELAKSIENLKQILSDEKRLYQIIKDETKEIKQKYSKPRKTVIDYNAPAQEFTQEEIIPDDEATIILTNNNYVKRMPTKVYREQDRGGKGIIAIELKEGDFVRRIVSCRLKDYLLLLSNKGRAYWLKAYLVPEESRYGMGKALVNLVRLSEGERVRDIINTKIFSNAYLNFITVKGKIKRVKAERFSKPRANGIKAMPLLQGDGLADLCLSDGAHELFVVTALGKALRFKEADVRSMGREAHGIKGIKLNANDSVVNISSVRPDDLIVSVTEKGYGKATPVNMYRLQKRGGKGVINLKIKEKTGTVIKSLKVLNDDNILMINSKGLSIIFPVSSVRVTGRGASGIRLMRLDSGIKVVDAQATSKPNGTNGSMKVGME
jgi:DNA gyrase subunit A